MPSTARPALVLLLAAVLAVVLTAVFAVVGHKEAESAVDASLLEELRGGGRVLLMRHAITDRSISDADPTARGGCDQQRPLSFDGREQARHVGQRLAALDIPVGAILASPFCRTLDTADLLAEGAGVGAAVPTDALLSTTSATDTAGARAIVSAGEQLLRSSLDDPQVIVLVTHTQNIEALAGVTVEEGDAVIMRLVNGSASPEAVIPAADW